MPQKNIEQKYEDESFEHSRSLSEQYDIVYQFEQIEDFFKENPAAKNSEFYKNDFQKIKKDLNDYLSKKSDRFENFKFEISKPKNKEDKEIYNKIINFVKTMNSFVEILSETKMKKFPTTIESLQDDLDAVLDMRSELENGDMDAYKFKQFLIANRKLVKGKTKTYFDDKIISGSDRLIKKTTTRVFFVPLNKTNTK